jgi:hypothetical protein
MSSPNQPPCDESCNQPCDEPCNQPCDESCDEPCDESCGDKPGICRNLSCPQRIQIFSILNNKTIDELKKCLEDVHEFLQLGGNDEEIEGMRSVLPFLKQIIKSKEEELV